MGRSFPERWPGADLLHLMHPIGSATSVLSVTMVDTGMQLSPQLRRRTVATEFIGG
jgi:hypothetical protein